MKKNLIIFMLFLFSFFLKAQNKTSIGFDFGIISAKYNLYDPAGYLKNPLHPWTIYSFKLSHELNNRVAIESGFSDFIIFGGPNFKFSYGSGGGNLMDVYQIPLRINFKQAVFKDKLTANLNLAYVNCINGSYDFYGGGSMGTGIGNEYGTAKYYEKTRFYRYFPLIETGVGLNYKLSDDLILSFNTSYQKGFLRVIEIETYYQYKTEPVEAAYYISKGDNLQFLLGLEYPFSNLWQQKQYRKDTKEKRNTSYKESFEKRFYAGFNIGPMWYGFKETKADEITARHGRHSFWNFHYAEMSKGLFTGIKFNNFAIETGFYRNNFSNSIFYKLTGTGYGWTSSELFWSEIPIKVKYNYHLPNNLKRIVISPFVGLSYLHSEEKGLYKTTNFTEKIYNTAETANIYENYSRKHNNTVGFNTGLGFEFYVYPKLIFTIQGQLNFGIMELNRISATTVYQNQTTEGDIIYKGNTQSIMLGFKRPFDFKKEIE